MNCKPSTLVVPAALFLGVVAGTQMVWAQDAATVKAAQAYRQNQAVAPLSDTTVIAEAEEFSVAKTGWQAQPWGANYYAATFANSFLSRKAFLGAPAQADNSVATIEVQVPKAGKYLALVRYEAAPRFETQFRLVVEQNGKKLDRLYGARDNLKIWAFGEKLKKEVAWTWGAVENVVWEGHDAYVDLQAGLSWAREGNVLKLAPPAGSDLKFYDIMGNPVPGPGVLVDDSPVYFIIAGAGESALKRLPMETAQKGI